jgi:hypothetical protein
VFIGDDKQVAADVRINIEDYKIVASSMEHKIPFVILGIVTQAAKNTDARFGICGAA